MNHTVHDIGVSNQIGAYNDAMETHPNLRWLLTSGTPGLSAAGVLPKDITGQAELAWENIIRLLERAAMAPGPLVQFTYSLLVVGAIPPSRKFFSFFPGEADPASMLLVISQLVRPEFLVEVEIIAAKA